MTSNYINVTKRPQKETLWLCQIQNLLLSFTPEELSKLNLSIDLKYLE